jgi:hypothetical protein
MKKWQIKKNEEISDSDSCELRENEDCTKIQKKCNYFLCPRLSRSMLDKYDRELIASRFKFKEKIPIAGLLIATSLYSIQSESPIVKTVITILLLYSTVFWIMSNISGTFVNLNLKKYNFDFAIVIAITTTALIVRFILIMLIDTLSFILGPPTTLVIRVGNVDYNTFLLTNESALFLFSVGFSFCIIPGLVIYAILKTPDEQYIKEWKQEVDNNNYK